MSLHALIQELMNIQTEVAHQLQVAESASARDTLVSLEESAFEIDRAWSKSWIGDHANLYYRDFKPPPPGEEFDQLSGKLLRDQPSWVQYSDEEVRSKILASTDASKLERATQIAKGCAITFEGQRGGVISILELAGPQESSYINGIRMAINDVQIPTEGQILKNLAPNGVFTRDVFALSKRPRTPPHLRLFAEVASIRHGIDALNKLNNNIEFAIKHFQRVTNGGTRTLRKGDRIFIGHGHSHVWLQLEKFLKERLNQTPDEFNRVPTAGVTTVDRLKEMLDGCKFAFLVLTAEDETAGGQMQARMNVIHEAGLFQGRLGFDKAIILLEDGCKGFSNIEGLGQIRFPKGDIEPKYDEIRRVLEDRGIIPS